MPQHTNAHVLVTYVQSSTCQHSRLVHTLPLLSCLKSKHLINTTVYVWLHCFTCLSYLLSIAGFIDYIKIVGLCKLTVFTCSADLAAMASICIGLCSCFSRYAKFEHSIMIRLIGILRRQSLCLRSKARACQPLAMSCFSQGMNPTTTSRNCTA